MAQRVNVLTLSAGNGITTTTWEPWNFNGSGVLLPAGGGTGIANNNASTIAISGNFATTLTVTGTTGVTLPTTGTLATLAGSEAFTNKTYGGVSLTLTGTTDSTSITTGNSINPGGASIAKALWVGGLANIAGAVTLQSSLAVTGTSTLRTTTLRATTPEADNTYALGTASFRWSDFQGITANFAGAVGVSGLITKTNAAATSSNFLVVTGSTTANAYAQIDNTSANVRLGVESSTGGTLATGTTAYSGYIGSAVAKDFHLFSNSIVTLTSNSAGTGITITGTLGVTSTIKPGGFTVATLPAGAIGMKAYVTDAVAPAFLTILVGGGGAYSGAQYNGANWVGE